MKRHMMAAALAALPALGLAPAITGLAAGSATAATGGCALPSDANDKATRVASGLNAFRANQGLGRVTHDRELSRAAQVQACDLARTGQFGHRGSDGSNHRVRVERTGYCAGVSAENLAWGYPDPAQIITGWQGSPGHRQVMALDRAEEFGVGIAQGAKGPVWVLVMAQPC
ncbi:CAP domain-containing protein [Limimaricola hongkongensis]|uniref:Allergen V5/Tpx-1 related protein n=1 Tax=Limimaricola hongkongensis DSM 17492 TaxID=1122180 RepID=A0A017H994_9RHOB|nr:CAP domain-containing protein [Limimaricola hongkongensis]EYD70946.1 Allergen V5/Tpx-1 related protein [Limimaricola hongkongensis DSM 17492]